MKLKKHNQSTWTPVTTNLVITLNIAFDKQKTRCIKGELIQTLSPHEIKFQGH